MTLYHGDCREVLPTLGAESIDACVTDPPYALEFMGRAWDRFSGEPVDPAFMHWLAGFIDGEGCFHVHRKVVNGCEVFDCQFAISLRADDKPILERIQRTLRMGTLHDRPARGGEAQARYCVSRKADCVRLRDLLRAFPLRAKKASDFALWSDAVDRWVDHRPGDWDEMADVRKRLMANREFKPKGVRVDPFQMWTVQWAREVYRVLKPGGHMLAFGGTRTYHRLVAGIEDAGFEIRDTITYLYGAGFPKSLNVSQRLADDRCRCPSSEYALRTLSDADVPEALRVEGGQGPLLFAALPEPGTPAARRPQLRAAEARGAQSSLEGRRMPEAPEGQLPRGAVRQSASVGTTDGEVGRIHHGAPLGDGPDVRSLADADGSGGPHRPQPLEQHPGEPGTVARQRQSQARGSWPDCSRCGKPMVPEGLGTALKPACELIVVARKPLSEGSVAANVLEHGTGALNIDGCRIGTGERPHVVSDRRSGANGTYGEGLGGSRQVDPTTLGRWPANVVLDDAAATLLDESTGDHPSGYAHVLRRGGTTGKGMGYGSSAAGNVLDATYGDTGGPSRFFYTAKADGAERNQGLGSRNTHPTVKPVSLLAWLVRLVTPPRGVVLDPFLGSGTTAIAAIGNGFRWVGIEREAEYVQIAQQRIGMGCEVVEAVA